MPKRETEGRLILERRWRQGRVTTRRHAILFSSNSPDPKPVSATIPDLPLETHNTPFSPTVCGILGLILHNPDAEAGPEICEALGLLQHRGQDACGIVTCGAKGRFYQCKANGMVRDVFDPKSVSTLLGGMGIGHGKQGMRRGQIIS